MERVVFPRRRSTAQLETLAHRLHQRFQGLDGRGYLVRLYPADRRLVASHPARQTLLAEAMTPAGGADQSPWSHALIITNK